MKLKHCYFCLLAISIILTISCEDTVIEKRMVNVPVYQTWEEISLQMKSTEPAPLMSPGKIYFKDNFIFVNESMKGIHVIDNHDPANPKFHVFLNIPGNNNMAIKGDILYADSYIDLVAFDISDLKDMKEVGRLEDMFNYVIIEYPENPYILHNIDQSEGLIVGWEQKMMEVNEKDLWNNQYYGYSYYERNDILTFAEDPGISQQGTGVGGSMATYTIDSNALYVLHNDNLKTFDISNASNLKIKDNQYVGWGIETIFPYKKKLFIGSQVGMYIYDIRSPFSPGLISNYEHMRSCDPVVVDDEYAYVTLRSGSRCGGFTNSLEVIDISNLVAPSLLKEYEMINPHGLGIDDKILFICDGYAGLKVYDASDPLQIKNNLLASYPEINTNDVIPLDGILVMLAADGIYQYDYSNINSIQQISKIEVSDSTSL